MRRLRQNAMEKIDVSCNLPSVTVPLGPNPVKAEFAGDAYYQGSSETYASVYGAPVRPKHAIANPQS